MALFPTGLNRDSTLTAQGSTGMQKNGATLTTEAGRMGYLLTDQSPTPLPLSIRFLTPLCSALKCQAVLRLKPMAVESVAW